MKKMFLNVSSQRDNQRLCVQKRIFYSNYFIFLFALGLFLTPSVLEAQISGTVFRDFNADGTKQVTNPIEPGLSGIIVTAYNAVGTSLGTATTSTTGAYSFTVGTLASGIKVRLEFTLPTAYYPSNGSVSNSNVQFVTAGTGVIANLGINAPADYCHVTNPTYLLPCYVTNASTGSATASPALVTTTYLNGSTYGGGAFPIAPLTAPFTTLLAADKAVTPISQTNGMSGAVGTAPNMTGLATYGQIGTTWGTAYQRAQKQLFSAAFVKSNTDFGPLGIGGIYKTDLSTGTPTTSSFINLTAAPYNLSLGSVTRTLPASATVPYHDTDAFSKTCKIGLGGLEISDDDKTLWALVMGDNTTVTLASGAATTAKLVKIDIGIPATAPTSVTTYTIPNPACTGGNYRVFALKYYRGKLYVGGVCTAELAGTNTSSPNVKAIVYEFDPTAGTFTKVLDNSIVNTGTMGWSDTWSVLLGKNAGTTLSTTSGNYTYGRELALSDIDFDVDGSMILGFVDRSGFQIGFNNYSPVSTDNTHLYHASVAGDLLKACKNAAGTLWTLEVNGSASAVAGTCATSFGPTSGANNGQGPGNVGEFYVGDITFTNYDGTEVSNELGMGGLAMLYGSGQVLSTMSDVADFNSAGVSLFNNTTGLSDRRFQVLPDASQTTGSSANGKANSLGEPTLLCNVQPIEIGNIVWNDANNNGIQDANEAGINGVIVELYDGATKVGTSTTNAAGNFYFNKTNVNLNGATEVKPNTAYTLKIASTQFNNTGIAATPLSNLTLTTANATSTGLVDVADNDATIVSSLATIAYTTGNYGENNHTLDFGFKVAPAVCSLTLTTNVSSCYDSNGNTVGGSSVSTVQVFVDWTNNPTGETINVTCTGATTQSINPATASKPTILNFTVPANGSAVTVTATFSTTTTCTATQNVTAPAGNCLLEPCVAGSTGGIVWRDFNNDGIKDAVETAAVEGIIVKIYDCNGALVATDTTDYLGQYTFGVLAVAPSATNKYRIEFSNLPPQYKPTFNGTNGRTDVQFITAASCTVNYGVNDPSDYCQSNPEMATNCFVHGNNSTGTSGAQDVLVKFNYNNTGITPTPSHIGLASEAGTTWGLAYQKETKKLFSTAFMKRHAAYGPLGSGGIYVSDVVAGTTSSFVNLNGLGGINTGTDPHTGLTGDWLANSKDSASFHEVGKQGFGDMDISDDGKYLFVVNLFSKSVHKIFINNPAVVPTAANITTYAIPNPCGTTGNRPFALKYYKGKLYVGVTCSAENTQNSADLSANVYEMDPTTGVFSPNPAISFPLTYTKGKAWWNLPASAKWYPWLSDWNLVQKDLTNQVMTYPQPTLSDIEFDVDGSMILGIRDRIGDQLARRNLMPDNAFPNLVNVAGGDVLRAYPGGSSTGKWIIESNGSVGGLTGAAGNNQGFGGGEFYSGDDYLPAGAHEETSNGGLAMLAGSGEIAMTAVDPQNGSAGATGYNSAGIRFMSNTNGTFTDGYQVYDRDNAVNAGTFAKSGGLGDVELLCNPSPIQVGNYVWYDQDKDGVQDPCEKPLSTINVSLWKAGTQIASTTTNANGEYYFSSKYILGAAWTGTGADTTLLANTAYEIRIDTTNQAQLDSLKLTTANATANNGNDLNDSDASVTGNYAVIAFTTGAAGSTNHTLDFGFFPCPTITTPSATQTICAGVAGANITVKTNYNTASIIKFVKFTTDQSVTNGTETATELAAIYAGTAIATVTPTGASSPYTATYTWNSADFPNATSAPITYYVYAVLNPDLGASCRPVQEIKITVNPTPSVTAPTNQTVCKGITTTAVNFAGSAVAGTTYNWTNNTTSIGLTASGTGNIPAFTVINTGSTVIVATITVTPTANGCAGTAQTFTITVKPTPSVTAPANQAVCNTTNTSAINFTGSAVAGTTYSWTNNTSSIGLTASGTGNIAAFSAVNMGATAVTATIMVTPTANSCAGTPQNFTIVVNPSPTLTVVNTACAIDLLTYSISVTSNANQLTSTLGTVSGTSPNYTVSGITSGMNVTLTATNTTTTCAKTQVVTAPNCACAAITAPINPNDPSICEGTTTPALTATVGAGETIDWYNASTGGTLLTSGATSYTPSGVLAAGMYMYYAEARNTTTNCISSSRTEVMLTVKALPSVTDPTDQTVCDGESTTAITFGGSMVAGTIYNWVNDKPSIGLAASGVGDIVDFTVINIGSTVIVATITVTPTANGCTGTPQTFTITVNPTPSVSKPTDQVKCNNAATTAVTFSGSTVAGTVYDWTNNTPSIGLAVTGSGDIAAFTATNSGATPVVATITVMPTANSCAGTPQTFTITVNPTPSVILPKIQTLCNTETTTPIVLSGSAVSGTTYNWVNDQSSIGLAASGSGDIASFTAINTGSTPIIATITVTPTANSCTGAIGTITITVNPTPTLTVVTNACAPDLLTYTLTVISNADQLTATLGTVSGTSPNYTVAGIMSGSNVTLTATINATSCEKIEVVTAPTCNCAVVAAPTNPINESICENASTPALTATVLAGETMDWYDAATGGTLLATGALTYTPSGVLTAGTYLYYAESRNTTTNCISSTRTVVTLTVNLMPSVSATTIQVTAATCTNGIANTNGKIKVSGIVNGVKYSYGTNGTTGFFALTATALTTDSIVLSNLASPLTSMTYTFRIYGADTTCYEDITAILDPSVCPPCSISATFTQGACNNNGTTAISADDYFTVTVSNVTSTNGGTSGKYEVILNGNVLNIGGTAYGTPATVGGILDFKSDGATTYNLTVRDMDIPTCTTTVFTTTASADCSTTPCKPIICLPVTVVRN